MLWGALAIVVPIAIHFWHQKQGIPLPWAATQWLEEKQQQQSRGLRLDNLWLMVLRCLLIVLLTLGLAHPVLNSLQKRPIVQKVHLVQPLATVTDNFRFELSEALKKEERVVWALPGLVPVPSTLDLPRHAAFDPLSLQTAITQLSAQPVDLQIYMANSPTLANVPAIAVPAQFSLHTIADSGQQLRPFLLVKDNRRLYVNRAGKLTSSGQSDPSVPLLSSPAHSGPIATLLSYRNGREKQTVQAALAALTDVYGLTFQVDERPISGRAYTWVLTDQLPAGRLASTLYILSSGQPEVAASNVVYTNEMLTPATSERVETGQLPEWLGTQLLAHFNLGHSPYPLTQQDLKALFTARQPTPEQTQTNWQHVLLLVFLGLVILERWVALTKNA